MISRARGEHDSPFVGPWRPQRPGHPPDPPRSGPDARELPGRRITRTRRGQAGAILVAIALLVCGWGLRGWVQPPPGGAWPYPATPRAWFDAYLAAAVDDPARVCDTLLSPALAASYAPRRGGGCAAYFRGVEDTPVTIGRVLRWGASAVIEVRQRRAPRSGSRIVLDRRGGVWQAVDVIASR